MFHDHPTAGHPRELEMSNSIWQHYWWPGLRTYIKNYVQGCGMCQQFKIDWQPTKPSFLPTEGAPTTRPFANYSMDFIMDLPPVKGHDSILVVVDQGLTKGSMLENDHRQGNCTTIIGKPVQAFRTPRQDHIGSRTPIHVKSLYWTSETVRG